MKIKFTFLTIIGVIIFFTIADCVKVENIKEQCDEVILSEKSNNISQNLYDSFVPYNKEKKFHISINYYFFSRKSRKRLFDCEEELW